MAFKNGLSERLDELRFPSPRSPPSESAFPGYSSLSPGHSNLNSAFSRPSGDVRANLQRRFTTDSSKFSSSWNYLSQGPGQSGQDPLDLLSSFEKKRQHIEYMRETRRRFEQEMKAFDMEHEKEKQEMETLARSLVKSGISGHVSEPTTPPDDVPVPAQVSRPGRFSTSSVTSSPGFFNAFSTSSQFTSPQAPSNSAHASVDRFAGHSLPGSRRNSEKEDFILEPSATLRPGPTLHRYSLPSSNFTAPYGSGLNKPSGGFGIDSFAATKHLFNRDDGKSNLMKDEGRLSTPDITGFLKMTEPDDKFPTLSRRDGSNVLSANPDARELANSRTPGPDGYHAYHNRTRSTHTSMPQNTSSMMRLDQLGNPAHGTYSNGTQSRHLARHSLEGGYVFPAERQTEAMTPVASSRPTSLQSSYSTNDLPTVKGNGFDTTITSPRNHAEHFNQHNASLGRIPTSAMARRSSKNSPDFENVGSNQSSQTILQASAAPFGPQLPSVSPTHGMNNSLVPTGLPFPLYGYPIQPYLPQNNSQLANFGAPNNYGAPSTYGGAYRYNDSANRAVVQRRQTESESAAQLIRYANYPLEHYKGELYSLCKDQHGCRYLQRKLEERNAEHIQLIFNETYMHVIELMTDPFGNYLCQKLFEFANDEQRTVLINNAAPKLRDIAVNQHGTRALQKMIECITTTEQIQNVVRALEHHVVQLVQDLNGNHVIQKCLNHLKAEDADFIYEAVGANCMSVGTHRHGCCVIQRCIDHASGAQKDRLIAQIIENAFFLVQDPYGNYVVQYILDLGDPKLVPEVCDKFKRNVAGLSKQKFSSNVIEKCLRTANDYTRRLLIDEMLRGHELEKMLRDSYANYVVQTAMDHADPETRQLLVDRIRPILPSMRQTPHGRRIAGKIMAIESARRNSDPHKNNLQVPSSDLDADQVPKQLMQKPFMHQGSSQSNGFNGGLLPTPAASSSNSPPTGPVDGSCHFNPSTPNASNEFGGAQNALYSYF